VCGGYFFAKSAGESLDEVMETPGGATAGLVKTLGVVHPLVAHPLGAWAKVAVS